MLDDLACLLTSISVTLSSAAQTQRPC
jgi:hypothetical protein